MAPIFDKVATLSSPTPPIGLIAAFSPEFAALGQLDVPVQLLNILHKEYPLHGLETGLAPLRLGFAVSGNWPEGISDEEMDVEPLIEELSAELWPQTIDEAAQTEDEAGLKAVLKAVDDFSEEDEAEAVEISEALVKALDISIKLGCDGKDQLDAQSQKLLKRIADRLHSGDQIESLTQSSRAWPFLLKGALAKEVGVDETKLKDLGKDVIETVREWFARGPQASASGKKSLKELLEICDKKTREHWPEEAGEDHPKPKSLFADKPAAGKDVAELEKKLDVKLPADYKEFLTLSNGFERILADDVFEAPLYGTAQVEWVDAKEAVTGGDDDDDFDDGLEDEDEDEGAGPPAKKLKMMDGNKLLAIAKKAETARNKGTAAADAEEAADANDMDDDDDEDDDDDDDDDDLEAALAGAVGWPAGLKAELLPLPGMMHEVYTEEHDEEWPDIEKVVEVGGDEGTNLWLLPPGQVKKARDAYIRMFDNVDNQQKKALRWAMIAWAGSEEAFRKYDDWAFVGWAGNGMAEMNVWSSFRRYLEDMADNCEKIETVDDEEEADKQNGCFAYRLR